MIYYLMGQDKPVEVRKVKKQKLLSFRLMAIFVMSIVFMSGCVYEQSSIQTPTMSVEEIKSSALAISYDDLMRNNEIYGDEYFLRVATKEEPYIRYFNDVIWVNYKGKRLLDGDVIDVWGKVRGLKTYTAVLGNRITIPQLDSLHVELVIKAGEQ
jgi:hypothetical protein